MAVSRVALSMASVARSSGVVARGMASGTVKWFNLSKGFGFIVPDDGSEKELFVHQSVIQATGFRYLKEGEKVEFDVTNGEKGPQASNVRDEAGNAFDRAPPPREGGFAPRDGGFTPREPREGGFRSDRAPRGDRDGGDRRPRRERAPRDEDM